MYFDSQAYDFDTPRRQHRAKIIANAIRQAIRPEYTTALEFGCGTGLVGMELISDFASILFVDSSQEMVKKVRGKISNIPSAEAIKIDLTQEPFARRFDFIFSSMVLHHIVDIQHILSVLYQRLTPKGTLVLVDLNPVDPLFHIAEPNYFGHHGFMQTELAETLEKVGFSSVETATFFQSTKDTNAGPVPYSLFYARAVK
jgi:Predicted methyltransferase (contains TPR repeat)